MKIPHGTRLHNAFLATIVINALVGIGDLSLASLFIFRQFFLNTLSEVGESQTTIGTIFLKLHDTISNLSSQSHLNVIIYFLTHGIIKLFLAYSLLKGRLWAYPLAIFFFSIFSIYQIFPTYQHPSILNFFLLSLNLSVLFFVSREYKQVRSMLRAN